MKGFTFSLYQKLALTLTVFVLCLMFLMYYLSQKTITNTQLKSEQIIHLELARQMVKLRPELRSQEFQYDLLKEVFQSQKLLGPSFDFYLLDVNGNIKAHALEPDLIKTNKINIKPIKKLLRSKKSLPVLSDNPKSLNEQNIFSVAPIYYSNSNMLNQTPDLKGYLYIVIGAQQNNELFEDNSISSELILVIGIAIMLLVFLLILFSYFTKPLIQLTKQANNIWLGDNTFEEIELIEWNDYKSNEIHQLGHSVNKMIHRIQSQFKQLKEVDNKRKTTLADIAHDLRTPLASMSGYLEILRTQDNLDQDKQARFLDVAIRNSQLLKGYIDQIFELAYLDSGEVKIHNDEFSLSELIGDIVAKSQLQIKEKNISVTLHPQNLEFNIISDIEKLERLISNIVDNAIRHTHQNGKITFSIKQIEKMVDISITDNGVGIKEEDINQIFDSRFKAKNSIGDNDKNMGLGLSISQRLAEILDSKITLTSEYGKGSTFLIHLKTK